MPIDWIDIIHKARMNNKPHTEETKAKMRLSHSLVSKRPEVIKARSAGGFTSWEPDKKAGHSKAISEGIKSRRVSKKEAERLEQDRRNEINRARVAEYLKKRCWPVPVNKGYNMETNTIEDRLIIAAIETEGMPFPQRVLRAGLKRITPEQMEERFSCKAIQSAQNALIAREFIEKTLKENGVSEVPNNWRIQQFDIRAKFFPGSPEYEKSVKYGKFETWGGEKKWLWEVEGANSYEQEKPTEFSKIIASHRRYAVCKVEIVPVEKYVEPMPDRVMNSYLAACSLGFTEFAVAYPELKIQEMPIPQKDPILLGRCADFWFEIDYWE